MGVGGWLLIAIVVTLAVVDAAFIIGDVLATRGDDGSEEEEE